MSDLSNDARLLKRGDTFDPECWRTTHRLQIAMSALKSAQIAPTYPEHHRDCLRHPEARVAKLMQYGPETAPCHCDRRVIWPDVATTDVFNAAISFAHHVQNGRRDARNRD